MSLRDDAANDWQEIMNSEIGASVSCTVTNPEGTVESFVCRHQDIHQQVVPGTEELISARQVSISICLLDLAAVGFEGIRGIAKKTEKPWKVDVADINGIAGTFKVSESNPDASVGNMLLYLEPLS
jgi:hypothetical protein